MWRQLFYCTDFKFAVLIDLFSLHHCSNGVLTQHEQIYHNISSKISAPLIFRHPCAKIEQIASIFGKEIPIFNV